MAKETALSTAAPTAALSLSATPAPPIAHVPQLTVPDDMTLPTVQGNEIGSGQNGPSNGEAPSQISGASPGQAAATFSWHCSASLLFECEDSSLRPSMLCLLLYVVASYSEIENERNYDCIFS